MNGNAHKISNRVGAACVLVAALSGLLALGPPALATFPGDNGVIAFASNGDPFGTNRERDFEIFTMTPQGRLLKQLTFNDLTDHEPDWSPDGARIVFRSNRDRMQEIYVMDADGAHQRRLTIDPGLDAVPSWSADGTRIYFHSDRTGNLDVYVMNADGSRPRNLTHSPAPEGRPVESPDGRKVAFVKVSGS